MISSKPTELKLLRIKAGYSARQLAKVCALNYATISTAEKNQREVTPKTAKEFLIFKLRRLKTVLPRMRTIKEAVAEFKAIDAATAINETYLRRLILSGQVPHVKAGNKYLLNMEVLSVYLEGQTGQAVEVEPAGPTEPEKTKNTPKRQTGVIRRIAI